MCVSNCRLIWNVQNFWHPHTSTTYASVQWKDTMTGKWPGPETVLIWRRGYICIFSKEENGAHWLLERLVQQTEQSHPPADSLTDDDDGSCTL